MKREMQRNAPAGGVASNVPQIQFPTATRTPPKATAGENAPAKPPAEPTKTKSKGGKIWLVAALIAGVIGGAYYFSGGGSDETQTEEWKAYVVPTEQNYQKTHVSSWLHVSADRTQNFQDAPAVNAADIVSGPQLQIKNA